MCQRLCGYAIEFAMTKVPGSWDESVSTVAKGCSNASWCGNPLPVRSVTPILLRIWLSLLMCG